MPSSKWPSAPTSLLWQPARGCCDACCKTTSMTPRRAISVKTCVSLGQSPFSKREDSCLPPFAKATPPDFDEPLPSIRASSPIPEGWTARSILSVNGKRRAARALAWRGRRVWTVNDYKKTSCRANTAKLNRRLSKDHPSLNHAIGQVALTPTSPPGKWRRAWFSPSDQRHFQPAEAGSCYAKPPKAYPPAFGK